MVSAAGGRCIIGTVLTDSAASLTASLEPSQLMAPVLSLVERQERQERLLFLKSEWIMDMRE